MRDFARSDHAGVQTQLDRLGQLSVPDGRLGLETIRGLLDRLDNPHRRLPPVFHVAGTNGKGSTCAFLRAMLEAQGYAVHVTTSPHLVRYNERIRVAGRLIEDDRLAELLREVLDAGDDLNPSFFEVTIAAAFTEFARVSADACVVEVGLGGRFDATNVLQPDVLAACGIASLGLDHERFLLAPEKNVPQEPMARIAFEKAGIAKPGVPLVTMAHYPPESIASIRKQAKRHSAPHFEAGRDWYVDGWQGGEYRDRRYHFELPELSLPGEHQYGNAGLATAMLSHQDRLPVEESAIVAGMREATWPGRLHPLAPGPLTALAEGHSILLDGGHNRDAGQAIAGALGERFHLILGMLSNKDPRALLDPLAGRIHSLQIVPVPGHDSHPADAFGEGASFAASAEEALRNIAPDDYPILIAGSLYLAGVVLRLNDEMPD
ncbi:folylpolyglutamate synthase/dihydrofolate synthase family protein [Erythrobacter sp.]|uniref:bifunctional folylpolyglutamate synthase/dihydrofolate synthase n=1 Tax=Erythrobacter sp. TaxID=1042 RepID=UPI001B0A98D1|nr:folylpolyglutamate synthase/dihydrofolate synthase family protein [Erythrobacter sp.]MBO6526317.1 bifunctional folylpolyglutamate synthase/dihydrofolate synthase [Erythrobacter sp.]MBO6530570.1 bifunctional folylpolyglutamate synthase/dihydrofolate synthase [Erythrobacter sp.]